MNDFPTHSLRALDASLNRLSEALRTVEDQLRFGLSLPGAHRRWKEIRAAIGELRRRIETRFGATALWRDVAGDAGAPSVDTPGTAKREDLRDLLGANVSRAREASRSVEETLRWLAADLAPAAERIRYRIYEAEGVSQGLIRRGARLADVRLYVLVTESLASRPWLEAAAAALRGGAQMIQLREKELPDRELLARARALREITAERGALLIVNDRAEVTALSGADGVHLGQDDLPPAEARKIVGPDGIIGISTHAPDQARRAEAEGADYIGVGPIYETRTKEHREAVGLDYIRGAAEAAPAIPGFAIGSVNRDSVDAVLDAGARRIAICTGIIAADDIEATARWFRERIDARWVPAD